MYTIPLIFQRKFLLLGKSWHSLNFTNPNMVLDVTVASHQPPEFIMSPRYENNTMDNNNGDFCVAL